MTELNKLKHQVGVQLQAAVQVKLDEGLRLYHLKEALKYQEQVTRLWKDEQDGLEPCRACGRKVRSPCHDVEGMLEGGPWDNACDELIKGKKHD